MPTLFVMKKFSRNGQEGYGMVCKTVKSRKRKKLAKKTKVGG